MDDLMSAGHWSREATGIACVPSGPVKSGGRREVICSSRGTQNVTEHCSKAADLEGID
jgi:hypothetical protein